MSNRSYSRLLLCAGFFLAAAFSVLTVKTNDAFAAAECPTGQYLLGFYSDSNLVFSSENRKVFWEEGESLGSRGERITPEFDKDTEFPLTVTASGLPSGVTVGKVTTGDTYYWAFKGTPRNEGESEITLSARSSLCGDDTGLALAFVNADQGPLIPYKDDAWEGVGMATGATLTRKIYDIHQIPFAWYSGTTPFRNVDYLTDGYFVVGGSCSGFVKTNPIESARANAFGSLGRDIKIHGGMYGFKENGDYIATQNVCYDGGIPGPSLTRQETDTLGCNELGDCETVSKVLPIKGTGNTFIREMTTWNFYANNRPPLAYRITDNGFSLLATAYDTDDLLHTFDEGNDGMHLVGNLVPVKDVFLGFKFTNALDQGSHWNSSNVIYSSNLSKLKEWSVPWVRPPGALSGSKWPTREYEIMPLAGIGDFVIGWNTAYSHARGGWDPTARVYRLTDNETLEDTGMTLPGNAATYQMPAYDPINPNRVAFFANYRKADGAVNSTVDLYEANETGITLVSSRPAPHTAGGYYGSPGFSIIGDYLLYTTGRSGVVTGNTSDPFNGCVVKIDKGTTNVATISLPTFRGYGKWEAQEEPDLIADCASTFGMSPNGDIIIGTEWGALYHYKLGGSTGIGDDDDDDDDGPNPPPVQPGVGFGGINDILLFASGYLRALQLVMGSGGIQLDTSFGGTPLSNLGL